MAGHSYLREYGVYLLPAAVLAGHFYAFRKKTRVRPSKPTPAPAPQLEPPVREGQNDLRAHLQAVDLDTEWTVFFEAVAAGESGFNNLVGLGNPDLFPPWASVPAKSESARAREAKAALTGYENNLARYGGCDWNSDRYAFGSGGWFAMLPSSGLAAFWGTELQCLDPWTMFEPAPSVVMAVELARRLTTWKRFKARPTWQNLRVGWGNPSAMNTQGTLARAETKFGDRLESLGQPRSFMYREVTPLPPRDPVGMLGVLENV